MKHLIKTIGLVTCLITFSACEFGKAPDMSKYTEEEEQPASLSIDGCDDACIEQFKNVLTQKYGADWDKICDENCIETELDAYTKSLNSGADNLEAASATETEDAKAQVSGADNPEVVSEQVSKFEFPENCDAGCQSEFMIYIVFNYGYGTACDDACKKAEFEAWFTPPIETKENEIAEPEAPQPPAPPAPPAPPPAPPPVPPAQPVVNINPDEINDYIAKLGFEPDTVVILTPKFALSTLDAIKANIKFTAEEGMLMDMLPTLMTKAKYLILASQKNTSNLSFVAVSPDAVADRNLETIILRSGSYQITASEKDLLKLGSNIGFAKLSNAILAGTPYSLVDSILKGTAPAIAPEGQSHAKCISILKDKTFTGFISRIPQPNSLQQLFNLPGIELQGPNSAACWYKVR